jgi:hypothetical protein
VRTFVSGEAAILGWLPKTDKVTETFLGVDRSEPVRLSDDYVPPVEPMPTVGSRVEIYNAGMYDVVGVDGDIVTLRRNDWGEP